MPPRSPDPASLGRFARAAGAIRPMSPTRDRPTAPSERGTIAAARPVNAAFLNSNGFDGADITSNCLVASPCALWIAPPDVSVAVGPSQVVETTNLVLHIYDRSGNHILLTQLQSFIGTGSYDLVSDPRVLFDISSGRYFLSLFGYDHSTNTGIIWVAVSDSSDATGAWSIYGFTESPTLPDYPNLGISDDKVVLTDNGFADGSSTASFIGAETRVLNKADMLAGAGVHGVSFSPDQNHFSLAPAQSLSSTSDLYLASINSLAPQCGVDTAPNLQSTVTVWTVHGVPNVSAVSLTAVNLAMSGVFRPPCADQPGAAGSLDTGDNRVMRAVWKNGVLATTETTGCNWSGDSTTRDCLHSLAISTGSSPSITDQFVLGAPGYDYYYPALQIENTGNVVAVFARSATSEYASIRDMGWQLGNAASTFRGSQLLKAGNGVFSGFSRGGANRWGDFFGASVDASDQSAVWVAGEYAKDDTSNVDGGACTSSCNPNNIWGTAIGRVSLQTPLIAVEQPAAGASVQGLVAIGGWAVDEAAPTGTGVDQMQLYVDGPYPSGTLVAVMNYGLSRPDVGAYLGNARFNNSGYSYTWDSTTVAPGSHSLVIYAHSTVAGWVYVTRTVTVNAAPPVQIAIDNPATGGTFAGATTVSGWAVDQLASSGTGIDQIQLYVDGPYPTGTLVAVIAYGQARPDVANYLGNARFTNSGYSYRWDISQLNPGTHTAVVYAHSTVRGWAYASRSFSVQSPPAPLIAIDSPPSGSTAHGTLALRGWAVDQAVPSGTGIDQIQLYLDGPYPTGTLVAILPYGQSRPDVGSYLGNARFTNSGYSYNWSITGLSTGQHTLVIYAHSTARGWYYVSEPFTVQ